MTIFSRYLENNTIVTISTVNMCVTHFVIYAYTCAGWFRIAIFSQYLLDCWQIKNTMFCENIEIIRQH